MLAWRLIWTENCSWLWLQTPLILLRIIAISLTQLSVCFCPADGDFTAYFLYLASQREDVDLSTNREPCRFATARVDIRDLLKIVHSQTMHPSNVVCCIMEYHAVVFYIYLGHENIHSKAGLAHECNDLPTVSTTDASQAGTFTYYLPIKL
jgi:hypothetical protein